jgi:hypothetical protein
MTVSVVNFSFMHLSRIVLSGIPSKLETSQILNKTSFMIVQTSTPWCASKITPAAEQIRSRTSFDLGPFNAPSTNILAFCLAMSFCLHHWENDVPFAVKPARTAISSWGLP